MTTGRLGRLVVLIVLAALYGLGFLWLRSGAEASGRADPLSPQGRAIELSIRDGRLSDALAQTQALARSYPRDPFVKYLEATIVYRLERWADASRAWDAYIAVADASSAACPMVAIAHERAGDAAGAVERYRQCAAADPEDPLMVQAIERLESAGEFRP